MDENGFIDYQVDFERRLSEKDDKSWDEAESESGEDYADFEMYYEEDGTQENPEDDLDAPVIIYNIYGEVIGPDHVVKQMEEERQAKEVKDNEERQKAIEQAEQLEAIRTAGGEPEEPAEKISKYQVCINIAQTRYEIVRKVSRKFLNWKCRRYEEDMEGGVRKGEHNLKLSPVYDLTWHDISVHPNFFQKLQPYQKVNMYPGIGCITKKHHLARNLMNMSKAYPQQYDFFPKTWVVPT